MIEIPIVKAIMLGPIMLYSWGFFVALGIITAYFLGRLKFKKINIDLRHIDNIFVYMTIFAFVGARLLWVLIENKVYFSDPIEILKIWNGGFAFTGGFALSLIMIVFYCRHNQLDIWKVTDALALPFAVGMFIGRFGCLFSGLHPGIPASFGGVYNVGGNVYLLAWPFWAILNWLIVILVISKLNKCNYTKGLLTRIMLVWWGTWRFLGDFLRANTDILGGDPRYWLFTPTQYLALFVLVSVLLLYIKNLYVAKIDSR